MGLSTVIATSGIILLEPTLRSRVVFSTFSTNEMPRTVCLSVAIALAPMALYRLRLFTGLLSCHSVLADNKNILDKLVIFCFLEINKSHIKRKEGRLVARSVYTHDAVAFIL